MICFCKGSETKSRRVSSFRVKRLKTTYAFGTLSDGTVLALFKKTLA